MKYALATAILIALTIFQCYSIDLATIFADCDIQDLEKLQATLTGEWFTLANGSSNIIAEWRWDTLITKLVLLISKIVALQDYQIPDLYNILCLAINIISTFFLCVAFRPKRYLGASLCTLSWLVILIGAFGSDTIVISCFTCFPLFTLVLLKALQNNRYRHAYFIILFYLAYHISETANQLALLFIIASFILAYALYRRPFYKRDVLLLFIYLIPAIVCLFTAPTYDTPDYPAPTAKLPAHVITDDGLAGMIRPTVGPEIPTVPTLDRPFIKSTYATPVILISLFIFLVGLISTIRNKNRTLFGWSVFLAITLILDDCCPEEISHIMPIATLNRLIPHWFYFSLTPLIFTLTVYVFILHLRLVAYELSPFLLALFFIPSVEGPLLQSPIARRAITEYQELKKANISTVNIGQYLVSPSLHILNTQGLWLLNPETKDSNEKRFVDIVTLDPEVTFYDSNNSTPTTLQALRDKSWHTRWSSSQKGKEWLLMRLSTPLTLTGIEPTPGNFFYTDFPRGIQIKVAESCPLEQPRLAEFRTIFSMPQWQGELKYTPSGYPYYGHYSHVRIRFKEATTAQCWLIERTGATDPKFDWSIAKIKVALGNK